MHVRAKEKGQTGQVDVQLQRVDPETGLRWSEAHGDVHISFLGHCWKFTQLYLTSA